jgi:hypothetical protein
MPSQQDDHRHLIATLDETLRHDVELVERLVARIEDFLQPGPAVVDRCVRRLRAVAHLDLGTNQLAHGLEVTSLEGLVASAQQLHFGFASWPWDSGGLVCVVAPHGLLYWAAISHQ